MWDETSLSRRFSRIDCDSKKKPTAGNISDQDSFHADPNPCLGLHSNSYFSLSRCHFDAFLDPDQGQSTRPKRTQQNEKDGPKTPAVRTSVADP
jgi:hypothetical protein